MNHPFYETAIELTRSGMSLVPTNAHKKPDFDLLPIEYDEKGKPKRVWTPFQIEIPSDEWLHKWFVVHSPWGIATIGGKVSGDLEILDFDVKRGDCFYEEWSQIIQAEALELFMRLVISSTPSGGYHTRYRCPVIEGNQKLATRPFHNPETDKDEIEPLIETRGEGGYALCPPSPGYAMIQGNLLNLPVITPAEREFLLDTARSFNQAFDQPKRPTRQTAKAESDRPGDLYNATDDFKVLLEKHGWRMIRDLTDKEIWQRPGKDGPGGSATWAKVDLPCKRGILHARHFYVFTSSTVLTPNTSYRPFDLLAFLEFNGDFHTAAKSLLPAKPPLKKEKRSTQAFPPPPNGDSTPESTETAKPDGEKRFADILKSIGELAIMDSGFQRNEKIQGVIECLVDLSPVEQASLIEKMKGAGLGTKATLESQLKAATQAQAKERRQTFVHQPQSSALPNIVINIRQMREITADTLDAIHKVNAEKPSLFVRSGILTRIRIDEGKYALAQNLTVDSARNLMGRVANFMKETTREDGTIYTPVSPPEVIAKDILALPSYPQFPPLVSVVGFPILLESGEFRTQAGYDPESRCYYHAAEEIHIGDTEPTEGNVKDAKRLILEDVLGDFPFVDRASLANTVAEMLTPLVRPLITGATPLFAHDAATPGTGKSLLASVCTLPFSISGTSVMTAGRDDDEWRKRITAKLMTGTSHVLIDNIKTKLFSGDLAAALTALIWEDRMLGQTLMIRLPVRCTWVATGNNLSFSDEIARRTVWIRLDAKMERPWQRKNFRHPKLESWVGKHRSEVLTALMVLVKRWVAEGKPEGKATLGSYDEWASIVGGILTAVGIEGFLSNAEKLYDTLDSEREAWVDFFQAWAERYGAYHPDKKERGLWISENQQNVWEPHPNMPPSVGVRDLFSLASHYDDKAEGGGEDLLDELLGQGKETARRTNLGRLLKKHRDRVFGGYQLEMLGKVQRAQHFRLIAFGEPKSEPNSEPSNLGSLWLETSDSKALGHVSIRESEPSEPKTTPSRKIKEKGDTLSEILDDGVGLGSLGSLGSPPDTRNPSDSTALSQSEPKSARFTSDDVPQSHVDFILAWYAKCGNHPAYQTTLLRIAKNIFPVKMGLSVSDQMDAAITAMQGKVIRGLSIETDGSSYHLVGTPDSGEVQR